MKDFILASLPFVIIAVCVAIIAAHYHTTDNSKCAEDTGKELPGDYICLGINAKLLRESIEKFINQ